MLYGWVSQGERQALEASDLILVAGKAEIPIEGDEDGWKSL